jgi:hypothetical protein
MSSFCIYVPLSSYNLRHFLLDLDLTTQTSLSDGSPPLQCTTVNAGESSPPFFSSILLPPRCAGRQRALFCPWLMVEQATWPLLFFLVPAPYAAPIEEETVATP